MNLLRHMIAVCLLTASSAEDDMAGLTEISPEEMMARLGQPSPEQKKMADAIKAGMPQWDADSDGRLSRDELRVHLQNLEVKREAATMKRVDREAAEVFKTFSDDYSADKDGDHELSLSELLTVRVKLQEQAEAATAPATLEHIDIDSEAIAKANKFSEAIEYTGQKGSDTGVPPPTTDRASVPGFEFGKYQFMRPWGEPGADYEGSEKDKSELTAAFNFADGDNNGKLSGTEFSRFYNPTAPSWHSEFARAAAEAEIKAADANGDGMLNIEEYVGHNHESQRESFTSDIDKDHDGLATLDELAASRGREGDDWSMNALFQHDTNKDGYLSFAEISKEIFDIGYLLHPLHEEL